MNIDHRHTLAVGFIFGCVLTSAVFFAGLLMRQAPTFNMAEIMGCLPGTQVKVNIKSAGERQEVVGMSCERVK